MTKRMAVYCFYDRDGIVDDYVVFFLRALRKTASKISCLVKGVLSESGRKALEGCTDEIIVIKKAGFDAWAYQRFVNGRLDEIREYDELIFCNNSFFGPLYPLEDVFREMDGRDEQSDFWGMTAQQRISEHLETYFMVFRKKAITSSVFADFFRNILRIQTSLEDYLFEIELTDVLRRAGFTYGSFIGSSEHPDCAVLYPDILVRDRKFPFVKRKAFTAGYAAFFDVGRGQNAGKCLRWIENNTGYDTGMIWQNLLRTQKMSVLRQNLNLNYILSSSVSTGLLNPARKTAVVCYVYYEENVDECLSYVRNAEGLADLYFVASDDGTLEAGRKKLADSGFSKVEFIKKRNKGRDVSTYLIDCAPLFDSYDYLCFVHDKKSPHNENQETTHEFFMKCMETMLYSNAYITNILNEFETHPKLGVAVMPPLIFSRFYTNEYKMHPGNKRYITELINTLKLGVPFDEKPVAPYGDMFWCRTAAMRKLFSKQWTYDDLPEEPVADNGTILHAIERIHPFVAQSSGYYAAWVHSDAAAASYMNSLYYIDRTLNEKLFRVYGYSSLPKLVGKIGRVEAPENRRRGVSGAIESFLIGRRRRSVRHQLRDAGKALAEFFADKKEIWDAGNYLQKNPDVANAKADPFSHYIHHGWKENRDPSRNLTTEDYLKVNPDCAEFRISPLEHYFIFSRKRTVFCSYEDVRKYMLEHGTEILKKSAKFSPDYYVKEYREKHGDLPEGFDPYSYYLSHGASEVLKPCSGFRVHSYLDRFPDLKVYGICPVVHYELIGKYL